MIDRGGDGEKVGRRLLALSTRLFRHWHRVRDGTLEWGLFQEQMSRLRREVKKALEDGSRCSCARRRRRASRSSRWRRVCGRSLVSGVSSRRTTRWNGALRHAVIWRRISGGTDCVHGCRFVERMLTVVATCRQHGRNIVDYLTTCFEATVEAKLFPSLLPVTTA